MDKTENKEQLHVYCSLLCCLQTKTGHVEKLTDQNVKYQCRTQEEKERDVARAVQMLRYE